MLSVLLATRNRSRILQDVLESYCKLERPSSGWKLIVVDNGSADQTSQVIASFANRLPLHTVVEPKAGKNFALNTGLGLVEGDLTVLTDDDAFPRADWLLQLRNAADSEPAYSMFGGAVVPRWEAPPPRWVQWLEQGPAYTLTNPLLQKGPIPSFLVFGPNMAIRTRVFHSGLRFDPSIGPRGCSYPMGSETKLTQGLEQQGHGAWYVPEAVVEHFVRKAQLKKAWVMQRAIRYGRGHYRLYYAAEVTSRKLLMGTPRYLFREIYEEGLLMTKACVSLQQEEFFRSRWRLNFLRGKVTEARILVRERLRQAQSVRPNVQRNCDI
jgi:glycosyltransferase involved in cell wall biosynthesis